MSETHDLTQRAEEAIHDCKYSCAANMSLRMERLVRVASDLSAALVQAEQRESRIKELARGEHTLCMSIVKRLQEIGEISEAPDTNVTGAIHGVINGYVSWKASAKAAEARFAIQEATIADLRDDLALQKELIKDSGADYHRERDRTDRAEARLLAQEATIRQVEQEMRKNPYVGAYTVLRWADTLRAGDDNEKNN